MNSQVWPPPCPFPQFSFGEAGCFSAGPLSCASFLQQPCPPPRRWNCTRRIGKQWCHSGTCLHWSFKGISIALCANGIGRLLRTEAPLAAWPPGAALEASSSPMPSDWVPALGATSPIATYWGSHWPSGPRLQEQHSWTELSNMLIPHSPQK